MTLTREAVTFELEVAPEDQSYVGNCSCIDRETDHENERWIREQLDAGNDLAWCGIIVRARPKDPRLAAHFTGVDSLWGVSARDMTEIQSLAVDHAMEEEALHDLNRQLSIVREALTVSSGGPPSP